MYAQKKNDIASGILLFAAVFCCMVMSGGLNWQNCIIPDILLFTYLIFNRKNIKFNHMTLFMCLILIGGAVALRFTLGDKQYGIHEYLKMICFVFAYNIGTVSEKENINKIISSVGLILAIIGLFAYCNFVQIEEFVFNDRKLLRLQSFVKYANTTAIILSASWFSIIALYARTKNKYLLFASSCVVTALFLTVSKAAIPIFVVVNCFLLITNSDLSHEIISQLVISSITAIVVALLAKNHHNGVALIAVVTGIFCSGKIKIKCDTSKLISIVGTAVLILLIFGLTFAIKMDMFSTMFKRFVYMKDALKLLKDNWLIGIGPGEWKYYQYCVQSTEYNIKYIHNGWLQLWLEYGFFAFASFVFMYAKSAYLLIKEKRYIMLGTLMAIGIHSFVDIDFSFGTVLIIVALIMGSTACEAKKMIWKFVGILSLCACFFGLTYMCVQWCVRSNFERAYLNNDYEKALMYAQKTEKLCPADSNLKLSIAALEGENAKNNLESAVKLSPLDQNIYKSYIDYLIDSGDKMNLKYMVRKYIDLAPKQEATYTEVKNISEKALEKKIIDKIEYDLISLETERRRKQENVIDRNELLKELNYERMSY